MSDGPYTHSSVTVKMAGISVIPHFLAHWNSTVAKSNMSAIYVLFNLCLKACKPIQVARSVVGWQWNHVPGRMKLVG